MADTADVVRRFVGAVPPGLFADLDDATEKVVREQLAALTLAATEAEGENGKQGEGDEMGVAEHSFLVNIGGQSFFVPIAVVSKDRECRFNDNEGGTLGGMAVDGFIDRDPTHFPFLLRWLASLDTPTRPALPTDPLIRAELRAEALFYRISSLDAALSDDPSNVVTLSRRDAAQQQLGPEWVALRAAENAARDAFVKAPRDCHPYAHLINVFDPSEYSQFVFPKVDANIPLLCAERRQKGPAGASSLGVGSLRDFRSRFFELCPVLENLDWSNLFAAGGSVVSSLCPGDRRGPGPSDIDLFVYGTSSEEESIAVLRRVYDTVSENCSKNTRPLIVRTSRTLTIVAGRPNLHVQIILRMYQSPSEVLLGFDLDSVACGFDGDSVWCLPRCRRALNYRINIADPTRQTFRTTSYEYRLWKVESGIWGSCIKLLTLGSFYSTANGALQWQFQALIARLWILASI
jgi:hypothetical protein